MTEERVFKYSSSAFPISDTRIVYVPQQGDKIPDMFRLNTREKCGKESTITNIPVKVQALIETADQKLVFISRTSRGKLRLPETEIADYEQFPTAVNNPVVHAASRAFNQQVASSSVVLFIHFWE